MATNEIPDGGIERVGGRPVLDDEAEIAAAFAARDALEPLSRDARFRVLAWVAESHGMIPPETLRTDQYPGYYGSSPLPPRVD